ncbi:hypothetical protein [Vibrio campbellii]|uniref:hypothetical protein n=1 Tax=Vibrio campbellii TaxID=680 RepID=UPI0005ED5A78|nr:hypothetical protein [Vibrio campbellii]
MKYINKLVFYFISILHQLYYFVLNRITKKTIRIANDSEYSISLTSYGKRLNTVYLTIESLARQKVEPVSITLWLSKQDISPNDLPRTLKRLERRGLKIKFVDENIRSYKKLYYEYVEKKDVVKFIMTVDDDVFYPCWLGRSALYHAALNNRSVVCFRSHMMKFSDDGSILPYSQWEGCQGTKLGRADIFPTGVGGVLYPIDSLKGLDLQKENFLKCAPLADDVWFKSLSLFNEFNSTNVGHNLEHFYCVLSKQRKGLELMNVGQGKNDEQLKASCNYFGLNPQAFIVLESPVNSIK